MWREGVERVEFVGDDWQAMHDYIEERRAIEGPAEVILFGAYVRIPGEPVLSDPVA